MNYFSLRKERPEPEPEAVEEEPAEETEAEPEDEPGGHGPVLTGLLGPGTWISARFGTGAAWAVHVVAVWACSFYGGWIAAGIVVVWLLTVLLFVPREHLEQLAARIEERITGLPELPAEEPDEAPVDPLVMVLRQLIADAPGVHLKTLAEHLQAAAPEEALDRAAVRAKLAALQIPTRASVRDASGRVNEGVHRADLVAWLKALPAPSPVAAPDAGSGPVATAVTCDVADVPTPVATPLSRLRRVLSRGAV
jgi:hypothetical protein